MEGGGGQGRRGGTGRRIGEHEERTNLIRIKVKVNRDQYHSIIVKLNVERRMSDPVCSSILFPLPHPTACYTPFPIPSSPPSSSPLLFSPSPLPTRGRCPTMTPVCLPANFPLALPTRCHPASCFFNPSPQIALLNFLLCSSFMFTIFKTGNLRPALTFDPLKVWSC